MNFFRFSIFLIFLLVSGNSFALSLEEYLAQTKEQNLGYNSYKTSGEASNLLSKKAFLLTSPNFFINAQTGFERQNQAVAFVRYQQLKTENYAIGVEQDFSFGLNTKLYYNATRYEYQGLNSNAFLPISYETNPVLKLTIPLWQNIAGAKIKASRDSIYYENQANKFNSEVNSVGFLIDSEKIYWQLVMARKIVDISKETLSQSEKILQNIQKKLRMNLGEKADFLQAKADVEARKLQLKQAQNDAKIIARNFNQKRFLNSDIVNEKLVEINFDYLEKLAITKERPANRADVKAADAISKSSIAKAKVEEENNKPKLDVFGQYGFNGLETKRRDSISNSFVQNGDEAYVGVNFAVPLAFGVQSDVKKGAKANAAAAKMNYRQKIFDQENDWQNLLQNLQDYQENLRLSRQIENLQKLKVENERNLLKMGRTSTYQVLLFEQDYNQSRINTLRNAYNFLSLIADKKNYDN